MRTVIAHGHIFKNAGTTFDWALEKNFGDGFCDHRDDVPMRRQGATYLHEYLQSNPQIKAISSHHMCDVSLIEGINIIPVFFLRHPIERVLSVYNFERKQITNTPGAIAAKKYDFKDYVKWRMDPAVGRTIRDYQTVYLAGRHTLAQKKDVDFDIFNYAAEKIQKAECIGLVEQYDESMMVIEHKLKNYFHEIDLSYIRQNIGKSLAKSVDKVNYICEQLGETFDLLLRNNAFDLALYRLATEKLNSEINNFNDPESQLSAYKSRCIALQA